MSADPMAGPATPGHLIAVLRLIQMFDKLLDDDADLCLVVGLVSVARLEDIKPELGARLREQIGQHPEKGQEPRRLLKRALAILDDLSPGLEGR